MAARRPQASARVVARAAASASAAAATASAAAASSGQQRPAEIVRPTADDLTSAAFEVVEEIGVGDHDRLDGGVDLLAVSALPGRQAAHVGVTCALDGGQVGDHLGRLGRHLRRDVIHNQPR